MRNEKWIKTDDLIKDTVIKEKLLSKSINGVITVCPFCGYDLEGDEIIVDNNLFKSSSNEIAELQKQIDNKVRAVSERIRLIIDMFYQYKEVLKLKERSRFNSSLIVGPFYVKKKKPYDTAQGFDYEVEYKKKVVFSSKQKFVSTVDHFEWIETFIQIYYDQFNELKVALGKSNSQLEQIALLDG